MKSLFMRLVSYRRRGVVLLLVMGAVAVLAALAVETAHRAQMDVVRVARGDREAAFRRVFDSGIAVAKGLLTEKRLDPTCDYWGDPWHRELKLELGPGEYLALRVEDETGKLNVLKAMAAREEGAFTRKSFARLFDFLRKQDPEREHDWTAAEKALKDRWGIPEESKNKDASRKLESTAKKQLPPEAPVTLDGLREAGIPADLIFGSPSWEKPFSEQLALCDYLTTFGDGLMNLNTAPKAVLFALDEEYDERLVDRIISWRGTTLDAEDASSIRPFRAAADLQLVDGIVLRSIVDGKPVVIRDLFQKVQPRVTVRARSFSARMVAKVDGRLRQGWAFFEAATEKDQALKGETVRFVAFEEIEP